MAKYNVKEAATTLLNAGWTTEQILALHPDLEADTNGDWTAWNRRSEAAIDTAAQTATEIHWTKINGQWAIKGANLTEGSQVTVTKRDGRTSIETVGHILRTEGAITWATTTPKQRTRRTTCSCWDSDTSNTGICYACGGYVASDDLARYF